MTIVAPRAQFKTADELKDYHYCVPKTSNFADVDAVIKKAAVFQMTITDDHPYVCTRLQENIGYEESDYPHGVPFFYVVPEDIFHKFNYQKAFKEETETGTTDGKKRKKRKIAASLKEDVFVQYVMCLDADKLESRLYGGGLK